MSSIVRGRSPVAFGKIEVRGVPVDEQDPCPGCGWR